MSEITAETPIGKFRHVLRTTAERKTIEALSFSEKPNTEAILLEKVLGISFGEKKPKKMILTWPNILRAVILGTENLSQKMQLFLAHFNRRKTVVAAYFPDYDTVVVYPQSNRDLDLLYNLHENMEAWLKRQNPEFPINIPANIHRLLEEPEISREEFNQAVERLVIMDAIREGLAEWGSIQTGLRNPKITDKEYVHRHNKLLTEKSDSKMLQTANSEVVNSALSDFDLLFLNFDLAWVIRGKETELNKDTLSWANEIMGVMKWRKRVVGYTAVANMMRKSEGTGLSTAEALRKVAIDPLTSFSELKKEVVEFLESGRAESK